MWTFFRAKSRLLMALPVLLMALTLDCGCATHAPRPESLYTPVRDGQAIGPVPPPPIPYYPYQPREVHSLDELPPAVRTAAIRYLEQRVGEAFYRRLHFAGGQTVDLKELHRVNPASRQFRPEPAAYVLRFDFTLPDAGIRRYTATVALRRDGSLLRGVDLPAFAQNPAKLELHPLREISAKLAAAGEINPATTTATVTYDAARDTLVWHFEQPLPGNGPEVKVRTLDVDAHTGDVISAS